MVHGGNIGDAIRPDPPNGPSPARHPSVSPSWCWSDVAATAVVAAVTAIVGVLGAQGILGRELLAPLLNVLGLDGPVARYAASAALAAALAGGLLRLRVLSTPRPLTFFTWIAVLTTLACAVRTGR